MSKKRGPKFQKIDQYQKPEGSRDVNNTQGSFLWQYNHFRTDILTSLLNDLMDLENDGMDENICQGVQKSLGYFVNASTAVPKGGFLSGGPLYKEIEEFQITYVGWNNINGRSPELSKQRRQMLSLLRQKRQRISNKVRKLQFELQNNLDQKILADCYNAVGELIKLVPGMFKNLASSYGDYQKQSSAKASLN